MIKMTPNNDILMVKIFIFVSIEKTIFQKKKKKKKKKNKEKSYMKFLKILLFEKHGKIHYILSKSLTNLRA